MLAWWAKNSRSFSWRESSDPYAILIAELLLRRTNAPAAQTVYREFLKEYPTIQAFSKGKPATIEALVCRLGLNWRAQNMVELARYLEENDNFIPETVDELCKLPGVGPYVARAVMVNCHELSTVPIDSNVVRVVCRFFGIPESDSLRRNKRFQQAVDVLVSQTPPRAFNFALLDLASMICRSKKPKCGICPISPSCLRVSGERD